MVKEGAINGTNETQDGYKNRRWNCEILWVKNGTNCATLNRRIKRCVRKRGVGGVRVCYESGHFTPDTYFAF